MDAQGAAKGRTGRVMEERTGRLKGWGTPGLKRSRIAEIGDAHRHRSVPIEQRIEPRRPWCYRGRMPDLPETLFNAGDSTTNSQAFRICLYDRAISVLAAIVAWCLLRLWAYPAPYPGEPARIVAAIAGIARAPSAGAPLWTLLARALCATEKMLLLDEPVAGLDPLVTNEMYELIEKLNDEGITVIMISHDIEAAVRYASHILHIGDRIFFETRDEYVSGQGEGGFMSGAAAGTGPEQISAGRKEEEQDAE